MSPDLHLLAGLLENGAGQPDPLLAYVGPGLGGGIIAVIVGFLVSIFLAVTAVIWYPIKRLIRKLRGPPRTADAPDPGGENSPGAAPEQAGERSAEESSASGGS
jgi:hypothetical protein